jgi:hypothetical protein
MSDTAAADAATSTEVVLRPMSELMQLNLSPEFVESYPVFDPEEQQALYDELAEAGIELNLSHLTRVKVPTGGITQFQIVDEDGVEQAVRELTGVVLQALSRRSFWEKKFDDADREEGPPDCASRDGITGDGMYGVGSDLHPTGDCASCPMAARGSAGTGTQASKCKTQKLLFLASPQENLPMIIAVPPASLSNWTKFVVGGSIKRKRGSTRGPKEISLKLTKQKNPNNVEYAAIEFSATGRAFTEDEKTVIKAFSARMSELIKENQEALDKMANAAAANGTPVSDEGAGVPFGDYDGGDADGIPRDEVPVGSTAKR